MKNDVKPTSDSELSNLPLVAFGRSVESVAVYWFRLAHAARLVSLFGSLTGVILASNHLLAQHTEVLLALFAIGNELVIHVLLDAKARHLQSLSRSIMERQLLTAAGVVRGDAAANLALKHRAEVLIPSISKLAQSWLNKRQASGFSNAGDDYHSSQATDKAALFLDILYENFSWWSELSSKISQRLAVWTVIGADSRFVGIRRQVPV